MLVLTRKTGESVVIGDDIEVVVKEIRRNQVRIGFEAPREIPIHREEVAIQIEQERNEGDEVTEDDEGSGDNQPSPTSGPENTSPPEDTSPTPPDSSTDEDLGEAVIVEKGTGDLNDLHK